LHPDEFIDPQSPEEEVTGITYTPPLTTFQNRAFPGACHTVLLRQRVQL